MSRPQRSGPSGVRCPLELKFKVANLDKAGAAQPRQAASLVLNALPKFEERGGLAAGTKASLGGKPSPTNTGLLVNATKPEST